MKKITKFITVLLCTGMLFGCTTEVAEFESPKDVIDTIKEEEKQAKEEVKEEPIEKTLAERMNDPDTLNYDNSPELKRLLTTNATESEYAEFFTNNQFNIIQFDGGIDLIQLLEDKKTRYELLLRSGDYDPNTQTGPTFKVKDVGISESSVKELFLSGNGEVGKHVKIEAKIYGYDEDTGIVELKLVSMSLRK